MSNFRRTVIGIAETVQILGMALGTLGAGWTGMSVARGIALATMREPDAYAFTGFVIGAAIGFVIAATAAGLMFTLAETEANTRRLVLLFEEQQRALQSVLSAAASASRPSLPPQQSAMVAPPSGSPTQRDVNREPIDLADKQIVKEVIDAAREAGYSVDVDGGQITFRSASGTETYCRNEADIRRFYRNSGLIYRGSTGPRTAAEQARAPLATLAPDVSDGSAPVQVEEPMPFERTSRTERVIGVARERGWEAIVGAGVVTFRKLGRPETACRSVVELENFRRRAGL